MCKTDRNINNMQYNIHTIIKKNSYYVDKIYTQKINKTYCRIITYRNFNDCKYIQINNFETIRKVLFWIKTICRNRIYNVTRKFILLYLKL